MRLATVSHSHISLRQQLFFKELARQGHEILMLAPGQWHNLRTQDEDLQFPVVGDFQLRTCRHIGGDNIYTFQLLGAKDLIKDFEPEWLYIQQEPESMLAQESIGWAKELGCKFTLFTWQNIHFQGSYEVLKNSDLVICGNPEAEALVKPWNPHTALILQVGVDTDHFQARPNVARDIEVAYVGRVAPEKGLPYVQRAWPTVRILEWKDFLELPWWYSQIQVVVAYSQDVPWWKEQAPNYVVLEALSCGCKAVVSDTKAMSYWLKGCPSVVVVEGHDQPDDTLRMERVVALKSGIRYALESEIRNEGRQWVIDRFSNPIVAKKLLEVLESA